MYLVKGKEAVLNMIGETVLSMNNQTDDARETETDARLELYIGTVDMSGRQREVQISLYIYLYIHTHTRALWFPSFSTIWLMFIVERVYNIKCPWHI